MSSYSSPRLCLSFEQALAPFHHDEGLPFASVLPVAVVEQVFADEGVAFGATEDSVLTPAVTLWAFLSQVLENDKSCRAAVSRVLASRVLAGQTPCSEDTAAYCRARAKLPARVLKRLALQAGRNLETQMPRDWMWHGKHVTLVDGTTMLLPDTSANQEAYPQQSTQKPGLGFPILRMVVLLSLATACLLGMALAPYQGKETGETALLRQLLDEVNAGDVLLADRYYCTYWLVAMAQARGIDVVFRMHHRRDYDFRRGQRLGADDHVVIWHKPQRPEWMDKATYATIPESLTVRELRVQITTPGCRTPKIVIVTTLSDATRYAKDEIADLYHDRWAVELDIRAIKATLKMDELRCLTPFMIEKEIWTHFLGYNLIRKVAAQAVWERGVCPRQISFAASQQVVVEAWSKLTEAPAAERATLAKRLLRALAHEQVGKRPGRVEPRAKKRRPKNMKLLTKPRAQARAELLTGRREKNAA